MVGVNGADGLLDSVVEVDKVGVLGVGGLVERVVARYLFGFSVLTFRAALGLPSLHMGFPCIASQSQARDSQLCLGTP